jgi:anti-sigma factor RsiW
MMRSEGHPSLEKLKQYFEGELPDFQESLLEDHLTECEWCAATVERMDTLLYSGFTARAHAAANAAARIAADPLATALRRAIAGASQLAAPLRDWLNGPAAILGAGPLPAFGFGATPMSGASNQALPVVLGPEQNRAQIKVADLKQDIEVRIAGPVPEIALLFETSQDREDALVSVAAIEKENEFSRCSFPDVLQGEYYIAIGPR